MFDDWDELREILEELRGSQAVPVGYLYRLSDLTGEQLAGFCATWDRLPLLQRRRLARSLVELAEVSFQVTFDAIFRYALDDPDAEIRALAIEGLWEHNSPNLIGPLLAKLRSDPSPEVRAAAATSLGRFVLAGELELLEAPIQDRVTSELLTVAHLAGESIQVRRRAIESVSYTSTADISDILETAYFHEDEQMRLSAIVGMGRSCDHRWQGIVIQELGNPSAAMRYEAAWACGEMSLEAAVPFLAQLIDDPDRQVCDASIWALGQISGHEAREVLLHAYETADEDTQEAVEEALAEQALLEGSLDFTLYDLETMLAEDIDDAFLDLWSADMDDEDDSW